MVSFVIFILSGVAIISLTLAKRFEAKGYRVIVFRAVSKGDERARDLYHKSLHFYSEGKVKILFFLKKQLPVRAKIYTNRSLAWLATRFEERFGDIRNSRLISKRESASKFVRSVAEFEKGAGELHEEVYPAEEEILAYRIAPLEPEPEPILLALAEEAASSSKPKKPRAPRKKKGGAEALLAAQPVSEPVSVSIPEPRKPRVKKVSVVEVSEY